jgi:hypothetical protein
MRRKKLIYERVQCEAIDSETARILSRTRAYVAQPPADITSLSVKRSAQQSRRERERESSSAEERTLRGKSHHQLSGLERRGKREKAGLETAVANFSSEMAQ